VITPQNRPRDAHSQVEKGPDRRRLAAHRLDSAMEGAIPTTRRQLRSTPRLGRPSCDAGRHLPLRLGGLCARGPLEKTPPLGAGATGSPQATRVAGGPGTLGAAPACAADSGSSTRHGPSCVTAFHARGRAHTTRGPPVRHDGLRTRHDQTCDFCLLFQRDSGCQGMCLRIRMIMVPGEGRAHPLWPTPTQVQPHQCRNAGCAASHRRIMLLCLTFRRLSCILRL
jgi:hypothetical protein